MKKAKKTTKVVEKIAGVAGQITVYTPKVKKPTKAEAKKDTLSCERCGHFLSMHNDRRGCTVQWCNCHWRKP